MSSTQALVRLAGLGVALMAAGCSRLPAESLETLQELPRPLTEAETRLIDSSRDFGLSLFARLQTAQPNRNVVTSPLSAFLALGMLSNGAQGETLEAIRAALGLGELTPGEANAAYQSLTALLRELDPDVEIGIANSIWHRSGLRTRPEFLDQSTGYFDAHVQDLDFADPKAPGVINRWVEEATEGRIQRLIERTDSNDLMFLINAVYFKGVWQNEFDPEMTRDDLFTLADGNAVSVPMMFRQGEYGARFGEDLVALELTYGRGTFSMTVLLPHEGHDVAELVGRLDPDSWAEWVDGLPVQKVILGLPRFRLAWGKAINAELAALGMGVAFEPERADFGRLVEPGSVSGNLYISEVRQSSFVEVDEEGTEAAAATSVGIGVTSAPGPIETVKVDRPFLFAIRERLSGALLFVGTVMDPRGDG